MSLDLPPIAGEFQNVAELRQASKGVKTPPPFSLRLTAKEKENLLQRAGTMPLGAYIRSQLLEVAEQPRRTVRRPLKDDQALGRLLGELGTARLANNLNQLAKAANTGSLPVSRHTEIALEQACQDVRWMRNTLVSALGLRSEP